MTPRKEIHTITFRVTPRECNSRADQRVLVGVMKIVKGDIVYLRSGKDVAGISPLAEALNLHGAQLAERLEKMPMAEQIAEANKAKNDKRGMRGKVLRVLPAEGKVVVEGLNMVTKHQKPGANAGAGQVQQGGRIKMEAALPISRVMLVCPSCGKPTRVGLESYEEDRQTLRGHKTVTVRRRICKQCKVEIPRPTSS